MALLVERLSVIRLLRFLNILKVGLLPLLIRVWIRLRYGPLVGPKCLVALLSVVRMVGRPWSIRPNMLLSTIRNFTLW